MHHLMQKAKEAIAMTEILHDNPPLFGHDSYKQQLIGGILASAHGIIEGLGDSYDHLPPENEATEEDREWIKELDQECDEVRAVQKFLSDHGYTYDRTRSIAFQYTPQ